MRSIGAKSYLSATSCKKTQASADGRKVIGCPRLALSQNEPRSVVVVEDEYQLRYNIVDFLDRAGFRSLEAANADEVLAHLKNDVIDTLYTDIDMPGGMNGLELVAKVRTSWPSMRVIVTSGLVKLSHRDVAAGVTFVAKAAAGRELLKLMA